MRHIEKLPFKMMTILFLVLAHASLSFALDVVVVETTAIEQYESAIKGFKKSCQCNIKEVLPLDLYGEKVFAKINRQKPDAILAVGDAALLSVSEIVDIPILYTMVFNTPKSVENRKNIQGIHMLIPPEKQLSAFLDILPALKTIGIIYTPEKTGYIVDKIMVKANARGIAIMGRPVQGYKDIPDALSDIGDRIDALWIVQDTNVVKSEIMELLAIYSMNFKVPLLSFTKAHLGMGAFATLDIDPHDMGVQTGEMLHSFHRQRNTITKQSQYANIARVSLNNVLVRKMDLIVGKRFKNKNVAKLVVSDLE